MITFLGIVGFIVFGFCMLAAMDAGALKRTILYLVLAASCAAVVF